MNAWIIPDEGDPSFVANFSQNVTIRPDGLAFIAARGQIDNDATLERPILSPAQALAVAILRGDLVTAHVLADLVHETTPDGRLPDRLELFGQTWHRGPCGHLHQCLVPSMGCCHRLPDGSSAVDGERCSLCRVYEWRSLENLPILPTIPEPR